VQESPAPTLQTRTRIPASTTARVRLAARCRWNFEIRPATRRKGPVAPRRISRPLLQIATALSYSPRRLSTIQKICRTALCDGSTYCLGLCRRHYMAHYRSRGKCSKPGCTRDRIARGRCRLHEPDIIHGSPRGHLTRALHRFSQSVHPRNDCWQWHANQNEDGYGQFYAHGSTWLAHRWAYAHWIGGHGNRQQLDHVCANTLCVRPDHLWPVSAKENSRLRTSRLRRPGQWITPARYVQQWPEAVDSFALAHGLPRKTLHTDRYDLAA